MIPSTMVGLFNNIVLLICLAYLYDLLTVRQVGDKSSFRQIYTGLILGVIGLAVMLNPWEFTHGVVFDTRSILLCITGFFFGAVPVLIAIIMTACYRIYIGGSGIWMGTAVIITSGLVGLAWRHKRKDNFNNVSWKQIYLMGIVVHVLMLFWTILLPWPVAKNVLANIALPVLLLYPIGTALLGQLMINRHKNKLAKEDLAKSEERFNLAMGASKDGLWDWDIKTDKIYYSPAYGEMLGYDFSELLQHADLWKGLIHPEDREIALEANIGCIENECDDFNIDFRMKVKNGGWKWINSRGKVANRDDTGRATRMVGTHVDITERKQSESTLKRNAEQHKLILKTAMDGFWLTDTAGKILEVNETYCQMSGYGYDELMMMTIKDLEAKEANIDVAKHIENIIAFSEDRFETRHRRKDGTIFDVDACVQYKSDDGGRFVSFMRDITERKHSEDALKESEAIHKELFDNSPIALYVQDFSKTEERIKRIKEEYNINDIKSFLQNNKEETLHLASTVKILQCNKAAVEMYKADSEESLLQRLIIMLKPDDMQHFINQVVDFTDGTDWFEGEARNLDLKDKVLDILLRKVVINREKNGLSKIIVSASDVTGLKNFHREKAQLETQIQQAQKMESIGNLAGGIAHDFNNILFPIIGYAEMLVEDLPLNSPERENAKGIVTAGKRGSELVKQILAFSRQNEHKLVPVRVQQVLKEVVKLSRSSIPTNIEINHNLQQDCGLVLADSTQLHQIGMNLITNAYHAVEKNSGKIEVQVKEIFLEKDELPGTPLHAGKYVQLSVSDDGCGISLAVMNKIFEPYFTTKEKGKGTGLGLAVVYGIVKEHKGDIKVFSEVGKGTTIKVYLPVMAVLGATESSSEQTPVGRGTERILLVDDEVPIASLMKQMLERLGYYVSIRTSSVDALEAFKAKSNAFDLVITDMSMPHMTGDQLASEMLSVRPDIPIIICTGFSERVNEDMAKSMDIKGFLMKPVIKYALAQEVRRVLDDAKKVHIQV